MRKLLLYPKLVANIKALNLKTLDYAKFMHDLEKLKLYQDVAQQAGQHQLIIQESANITLDEETSYYEEDLCQEGHCADASQSFYSSCSAEEQSMAIIQQVNNSNRRPSSSHQVTKRTILSE